jgi:hypothetical protein
MLINSLSKINLITTFLWRSRVSENIYHDLIYEIVSFNIETETLVESVKITPDQVKELDDVFHILVGDGLGAYSLREEILVFIEILLCITLPREGLEYYLDSYTE